MAFTQHVLSIIALEMCWDGTLNNAKARSLPVLFSCCCVVKIHGVKFPWRYGLLNKN